MNTLQSSYSPSALCFLTRQPASETVQFAIELAENISFIDVFIIVDDNTYTNLKMPSSTVRFLQFNETVCIKYGFQEAGVVGIRKSCSAWDKALYYFSRQSTHHSFVWFVEDDVFIPSIQAFLSLHELYSLSYDLITPSIEYNLNGNFHTWPHWSGAAGKFFIPWAHSMVCAIGCSRRLLSAVNEYAQWRGYLTFIEFLFHTLAIHDNKMKVVTPFELDTIVYRYTYSFKQIQTRPYNWWHPIKNFNQQREWRNWLVNNSSIDKNNSLITLNSIEKRLYNNNNTNSVDDAESQMKNLSVQFELVKGQIKSSDRCQIRDRFFRLATNRSKNLRTTLILLADHAFKLPENFADKINKTKKTIIHVKLEKAIENNKQTILRLMKNDNPTADEMVLISRLRNETVRLIRELTSEIQCEQQMSRCNRTTEWFELNYGISRYSQPTHPPPQQKNNKDQHPRQQKDANKLPVQVDSNEKRSRENMESNMPSRNSDLHIRSELSDHTVAPSTSQVYSYLSNSFGLKSSGHQNIRQLFEHLKSLSPMDKYGSMSGDCDFETTQMENFLSETLGFQNVRGQYIVQGVKSFRLGKSLDSMHPRMVVRFPGKTSTNKQFAMSVQEICQWQSSYAVYADKNMNGMSKEFLQRALQGLSRYGEEAFLMKFVVRISHCPILMEFDARIISRTPQETWPNNIKLISVTGVDFAGRIHDVNDITTYVSNWQDVYEIDKRSGLPLVYNGRDFRRKVNGPPGQLDKQRLFDDLTRMARLRLRACDLERVQIVVETGVGLGVFAGKNIGIDEKVRALSALAVRTVLERDGGSYQHIRGVVFALPIFDIDHQNGQRQDTYHAFADEFDRNKYQGPIPVLIADQDMHRLTVAIARLGFTVSELNPADSHGVFGEYWQNRGPAVEEKLALTTMGLFVQHHLINPHVLNSNNYILL